MQRIGHVGCRHGGAQLPGQDVAREVIEHGGQIEPAPADDLQEVKSVCQSWFGAVVGLAKRSAAFIRMKAGLVIRPWSFKSRSTVASDTKLPFVSVKLTASSRGDRSGSSRARLTIAVSILSGLLFQIRRGLG